MNFCMKLCKNSYNNFFLHSRPAVALIRKLIAVLESIERLPLHLYDTPGSTYNLQVTMKNVVIIIAECI